MKNFFNRYAVIRGPAAVAAEDRLNRCMDKIDAAFDSRRPAHCLIWLLLSVLILWEIQVRCFAAIVPNMIEDYMEGDE